MNSRMDTSEPVTSGLPRSALDEFEDVYRAYVGSVTGFFARRCTDPHSVADLTSETSMQAIGSYGRFDPRRGTARAWLFGIARHVYADFRAELARGQDAATRLANQRVLENDEIDVLLCRIDAEQVGRELIERWSGLPDLEREAIELVDLCDLTPREAAASLGVSSSALRVRLFRARSRLRKEVGNCE